MAELSEEILLYLNENGEGSVDSLHLAELFNTDHQKIVGAIKSLQAAGNLINAEQQDNKYWKLTSEGEKVAANGSYEALVFYAIPPEGILQQQLMKTVPQSNVGFTFRKVDNIIDEVQNNLLKLQKSRENEVPQKVKLELKKRKLLQEVVIKSYKIEKGPDFTTSHIKQETDLTPEMISTSSWKDKTFKPYNFSALGIAPDCGHRHPLMKVRAEFRQIFLEMGFTEMPTNNYIESSFWNFDALFQPQQHPARDLHDTFFVSGFFPHFSN
ncbi:phenylalanine--tRNA ligase alpha subunit A [Trichonephila clavipes]|nr:phenylalanine--tRNA ligase alpha subunit A [Trichonephila clavipes]